MTALAIRPWLAVQGIARAVVQIPSASRSGQSGWIQCKRTATEAVVRLETDGSKGTQASSDFPVDVVANTLSERQSIRAETVVSIAARDRQRHGRIEYAVKILGLGPRLGGGGCRDFTFRDQSAAHACIWLSKAVLSSTQQQGLRGCARGLYVGHAGRDPARPKAAPCPLRPHKPREARCGTAC